MRSYFPDEVIEEVRTSNDIVEVVSEYVQLKRSGRNYSGLCPFHNEKTPSFVVSLDKQIFHCFGCNTGGNVISFLMKLENISFVEAVQMLAKRARINLPEEDVSDEVKKKNQLKEQLYNVNTEAARFFHQNLMAPEGKTGLNYLQKRGLDARTIKKFGLGYSLDQWDGLNKHLLSMGYSQDIIFKAGLAKTAKNSNYIDAFRNRVMFPIFDISSRVIGFGGRSLGDAQPKYLNTSDTLIFNKSINLFALNIAKNSPSKKIIIVEGYMDAISLHQYGIDYAVACLGTALTEGQARLIRKYCDEVIVAYDSDAAGRAATIRGIEILNNAACNIKILNLPDGKDPDEYIRRHGVDKFIKVINDSRTYMQYNIDLLKEQNNIATLDGKLKFLNKISLYLSKIDNNMEREAYISLLSKDTGISAESIIAQVNKRIYKDDKPQKIIRSAGAVNKPVAVVDKKLDDAEKLLIYLTCQTNIYEKFKNLIVIDLFTYSVNKSIAQAAFDRLTHSKAVEPGELMIELSSEEETAAISKIFSNSVEFDDYEKAVQECINYLTEFQRKAKLTELLKKHSQITEDLSNIREINELIRTNDAKPLMKGGTTGD